MKKLLLILLCLPIIGFGQDHDEKFIINGKDHPLIPITNKEFNNCKQSRNNEENTLRTSVGKIMVEQGKDTIVLILGNSETIQMPYYYNLYISSLSDFPYWLLVDQHNEGSDSKLINKYNGDQVNILDTDPVLSPDTNLMIFYNMDIIARYSMNGIQLLEIKDDEIIFIFEEEVSGWGPTDVCWKDNSTLYIEQSWMDWDKWDEDDEFYINKKYKKVMIK